MVLPVLELGANLSPRPRGPSTTPTDVEWGFGFLDVSFPEQLERTRKAFLVFDAFVALIGFIALFVAGLGIANTMVISIRGRTHETGILKSLGAEDTDVRSRFLACAPSGH